MSNFHRLPRWTRRGRITFATASVFILVTHLVTHPATQLLPVARAAQDAAQQAIPTRSADQSGDASRDGSGASTVDLPQVDPSTDTSDTAEAQTTESPTASPTASPTLELSREERDLRQKTSELVDRIHIALSSAATPEEKARWIDRLQIQPGWNPTFEELRRIDEVLQGIERENILEGITVPPSPNDASCFMLLPGLIFWIWLFRAIRGRGGSGHGGPQSPPLQALAGAHSPQGRRSTGSGSGLPDTLRITDDKH